MRSILLVNNEGKPVRSFPLAHDNTSPIVSVDPDKQGDIHVKDILGREKEGSDLILYIDGIRKESCLHWFGLGKK